MRIETLILRAALVATLAGTSGIAATIAQATVAAHTSGAVRAMASDCAAVTVKATPKLNTAMIPETIKSKVTNCASTTEMVTLTQKISGPTSAMRRLAAKEWKLTIPAGQTVTRTRSFPYACCGSYNVTDNVRSTSGQQLARARTGFTFA